LAVIVVTLTFTGFLLHFQLKPRMIEQHEEALAQQLVILGEVLNDRWSSGQDSARVDRLADDMGRKLGLRVTLIEPGGEVLGDSQVSTPELASLDNHGTRPEILQALADGRGSSIRHSATLGLDLLYVAGLLRSPGDPGLVIRLARPLEEVEQTLQGVRKRILLVSLLGVLLSPGRGLRGRPQGLPGRSGS
jgi:two-component system phosphate regulon sensor histidine kinase PhoR